MGDEEDEIPKYVMGPSQKLNGLKELQRKEEYFFMKNSKKTFIELEKELQDKNSYLGKTKITSVYKEDMEKQKQKDLEKIRNSNNKDTGYCQKCPVYRNNCPHKNQREQFKDKYSYPITSSSTYGWLPESDNFKSNYRLNQATKEFYNCTHLS